MKKMYKRILSVICMLAILAGIMASAAVAAETDPVKKYNYIDLAGVGSNTYTSQKWSRAGTDAIDAEALAALGTEGAGIEHTFGLTVDSTDTAKYTDLNIIAFAPEFETLSGAATRGYGVKLILSTGQGAFHFFPNYLQGKDGTSDAYCGGTSGYSGPGGTGLQVKAFGSFSDSVKAKLQGNGETVKITIGFKVHDIADNGDVTVEYYLNLDGAHTASIYTLINKETSFYKNQETTPTYTNAYNMLEGGGLIVYSASGVTVGGAAATSSNYKVTLSDVRTTNLVPDCDSSKGTMLIDGKEGTVESDNTASITVTPKAGYDLAGIMVGSNFIPAPVAVNGVYTFDAAVPGGEESVTVKPMFVTVVDMLDYGTTDSVTSTKNNKHIVTAGDGAAHNTEFAMNVTFDEGEPTWIQINAFLQESKQEGSNYSGDAASWESNPYTPEYGFTFKMHWKVVYLLTNYGRTVDDVVKVAALDSAYTSGYGWSSYKFTDHGEEILQAGQTIALGLGEIQLDENNIIYYVRMNGKVIMSVPVDLSKKLTVADKGVVDSQNHVGNRVAFNSGDTAKVTVSSIHTPVDHDQNCTTAPVCSDCGHELYGAAAAHTYTDDHDTSCDVAGCTGTRDAVHTVSTEWSKDDSGHWHACSGCDEKFDYAEHAGTDDDNCTTAVTCTCGHVLVAAQTTHTYTDDADDSCDTAGCTHTRTAYTVTWMNGTEVLKTEQVLDGVVPEYDGETPVKEADEDYTYTFSGWDKDVVAVVGDVTYTAVFTSTEKNPETGDVGVLYGIVAMLMSASGMVALLKRKEY